MLAVLHVLLACDRVPDLVDDARPTACDTRVTSWADADADGAGDPSVAAIGCTPPDGYVLNADDCDDADPNVTACNDSADTGDGT